MRCFVCFVYDCYYFLSYNSAVFFTHKATLCSMKGCMRAMVAQLKSDSEDLQQVGPSWTGISWSERLASGLMLSPAAGIPLFDLVVNREV